MMNSLFRIFGCRPPFLCSMLGYCTIILTEWIFEVFFSQSHWVSTPSRSSASLTYSRSGQTATEDGWRTRRGKLEVRSSWNQELQRKFASRDTKSALWKPAELSSGCAWPPDLPPAAFSTCSSGSETRFSPESPSGAETRPDSLSRSCSGTASGQTWTPAGTPGCG